MSHTSNARRLSRMKRGKKRDPWLEAAYACELKRRAERASAEAAPILAETDRPPMVRSVQYAIDNATEMEAQADPAPPQSHRRVWSETIRPGRDDILTWDEAMRVPWIDGNADDEER